jgi:nitrous oxide reductase
VEVKPVRFAQKSTVKRRTLTGVVELISLTGAVRCGGVAVSGARTSLAANSESISPKTKKI